MVVWSEAWYVIIQQDDGFLFYSKSVLPPYSVGMMQRKKKDGTFL